jgi:hypothetical protein
MDNIAAHQEELDRAFAWVRRIYEQSWALRNAAEMILRAHNFKKLDSAWRNESQPADWWRFVYMDVDWYAPVVADTSDTLLVLAMDYTSVHRVGCHFHVAACTVSDHIKRLSADRVSLGDMLNMAVRLQGHDGRFELSTSPDGLAEALPTQKVGTSYRRFVGDFRVRSASFPVAWLSSQERLAEIVAAGVRLVIESDGAPLAALERRATTAGD